MNPTSPRRTDPSKGTLLNTVRANNTVTANTATVTLQSSFYCRAPRTWNTLPSYLKRELENYYLYLTKPVYDVDTPQTNKNVCIKYHTNRPLASLLDLCC